MDKEYIIKLFANNDRDRAKGLMFTKPLKDNECAFFSFGIKGNHKFWNKNVSYPLSLAFCNDKGIVVAIKDMDAYSEKSCDADSVDVKYVIETIRGALNNVREGNLLLINDSGTKLKFVDLSKKKV